MSKLFAMIATLFITSTPAMAAPSACLSGIVEAKGWADLTSEQIECVGQSEEANAGLIGLCSSNQKDFSNTYKIYRGYEVSYKEAFQVFQSSTDESTRIQARANMLQIDRDWRLSGFKREVAAFFEPLWRAKSSCQGR